MVVMPPIWLHTGHALRHIYIDLALWERRPMDLGLLQRHPVRKKDVPVKLTDRKAHSSVCMYFMIGKGQIAQKRPYWGENRLKSTIKGKYKYLVVF